MAYLPALSGLARSGVTFAGWTPPTFAVRINGTDRTSSVLRDGWAITHRLGSPSVCTFTLDNLTPTIGHDVIIRHSAPGDDLFGGTLLQAEAEIVSPTQVLWHCTATGYAWLLGQFTVTRSFVNTSINTILHHLIADYTDGDFSVGYCPINERVSVDWSAVPLPQALDQLASIVTPAGAWWRVSADKRIDLCAAYPCSDLALGDTTAAHRLRLTKDLTQVRTRTRVTGQRTTVTAAVSPGATEIPVAEIGWFQPATVGLATGEALAGPNDFTYTGILSETGSTVVDYGPGTITGVSGITAPIAEGETVSIVYTYDDTSAQTALAATLGSPSTGIVTHWIHKPELSLVACAAVAEADVTQYGSALTSVEYATSTRGTQIGRVIAAAVTTPVTVSGDFLVQQMTIEPRGRVAGTTVDLWYTLTAGASYRRMNDLLGRIA